MNQKKRERDGEKELPATTTMIRRPVTLEGFCKQTETRVPPHNFNAKVELKKQ